MLSLLFAHCTSMVILVACLQFVFKDIVIVDSLTTLDPAITKELLSVHHTGEPCLNDSKCLNSSHHTTQWVTLCFAKTKVLNSSFKPKLNLDTKIQFQTNAQFDFGFKPKFWFETEF